MTGNVPGWLISSSRALVILAPRWATVSERVGSDIHAPDQYDLLLARLQRLRGAVYLEDGAITGADLTPDGRHVSAIDERAWHVLAIEAGGHVRGCACYLSHRPSVVFSDLVVRNSALARDPEWGDRFRLAVEAEVAEARARGLAYAEVGGWAIDRSMRAGTEALRIALGTYALSRKLGGCIGITTATVRHRSAATLEKIGGSVLSCHGARMPFYYDPQYQCEMGVLRFESDQANPRFESWIDCLEIQLRTAPVVYRHAIARQPGFQAPVPRPEVAVVA